MALRMPASAGLLCMGLFSIFCEREPVGLAVNLAQAAFAFAQVGPEVSALACQRAARGALR